MKNIKITHTIALVFVALLVGGLGGYLLSGNKAEKAAPGETKSSENSQTWTCSMHPQIRQNEPGKCPICGMDLIPLKKLSANPNIIEMSNEAVKLANIQTSKVGFTLPEKEILLQGKVKVDERRVSNQTSHISGRIEKLYVSFTGEKVAYGQKIASIYSPELITAQKELFEAIKTKDGSSLLYNAARNKLKQWKLTDKQIDAIEKSGQVQKIIDIRADKQGVVLKRNVAVGDHLNEGSVLFTVADLSRVWVIFDAYEADIAWLDEGDEISFTVSSIPGETFEEKVDFIDPIIDPQTRTAAVRIEVSNKNGQFKPEMFASGRIIAELPIEEAHLTVPKSSVMWTGKRSVVYVSVPEIESPVFEFREVTLGHDLGGYFIVEDGLKEGEMVVTHGAFKVDAAAQLAGKKSMMNKDGGMATHSHQHSTKENDASKKAMAGMEETSFMVSGNCDMCKSRIEKAAESVDGVRHAVWNKDTKHITVHFDGHKTNKKDIADAISKVGHDTELSKSPGEIYNELPGCCQYTRTNEK